MTDSDRLGAAWESAVGKFMLGLGGIERVTISLFGLLPECRFPEAAKLLSLSTRIVILLEIAGQHDAEAYKRLASSLKGVRLLTEKRNIVAHNDLAMSLSLDGDEVRIDSFIVSARNEKTRLSLTEVESLASEAWWQYSQLMHAVLDLRNMLLPDIAMSAKPLAEGSDS